MRSLGSHSRVTTRADSLADSLIGRVEAGVSRVNLVSRASPASPASLCLARTEMPSSVTVDSADISAAG